MTGRSFSGRCVMNRNWRQSHPTGARLLAVALILASAGASAQEAVPPPVTAGADAAMRPSTAAEASYQDLEAGEQPSATLDEAIFTEISPLSVPETAIKLPPDQEH